MIFTVLPAFFHAGFGLPFRRDQEKRQRCQLFIIRAGIIFSFGKCGGFFVVNRKVHFFKERFFTPLSSGCSTRLYGGGQTTTRAYVQNGLSPVWGHSFYRQLKRWAKYQHGNKNRWWIYYRYFQNNHFTDQRITKKGIEHNRLYRIAYVPIRYHVKVKSKANPFLPEFDKYFFKRTKWREDLAKECKQVTTFVMQETINHGRVSLGRDSLKRA